MCWNLKIVKFYEEPNRREAIFCLQPQDIVKAIEDVLRGGRVKTKDLRGTATTSDMGDVIMGELKG